MCVLYSWFIFLSRSSLELRYLKEEKNTDKNAQ